MGQEIIVLVSELRKEAARWLEMWHMMTDAKDAIDRIDLAPTAFIFGDIVTGEKPATELVAPTYAEAQARMIEQCEAARVEFDQFAAVIYRIAKAYEDAEQQIPLAIRDIFKP